MGAYDDPAVRKFLRRFEREVLPKMRDSNVHVTVMSSPDKVDAKLCLELGASILLHKPLIIFVPPGVQMPHKLSLIADAVISGSLEDPAIGEELRAAIARLTRIQ